MRTSNPALTAKAFENLPVATEVMTINGTVNKSLFLISLVFLSAYISWQQTLLNISSSSFSIPIWYYPLIFVAFIVALIIIFKKTTAPYLAPVYAILEGALLGVISSLMESLYSGIVLQAILCTFGTFAALLITYKFEIIKATENFKLGVIAATGGIAIVYIIDLVLSFFGMNVPFIHETGPMGIAVSVIITIVAALNLVLDFDFIEQATKSRAPKYMEWYASFGLLVTLIWLYLEILRLLGKSKKN